MKVKTVVNVKYASSWASYNGLEISDGDGNSVVVEMNDSQVIELADRLVERKNRILKERKEAALELSNSED